MKRNTAYFVFLFIFFVFLFLPGKVSAQTQMNMPMATNGQVTPTPLAVMSQTDAGMNNMIMFTGIDSYIMWAINFAGIAFGIASILLIFKGMRGLGGEIGNAFQLVLLGIFFQVLSFIWETLNSYYYWATMQTDMITHISLMLIGMVMFVLAARKFLLISK